MKLSNQQNKRLILILIKISNNKKIQLETPLYSS